MGLVDLLYEFIGTLVIDRFKSRSSLVVLLCRSRFSFSYENIFFDLHNV